MFFTFYIFYIFFTNTPLCIPDTFREAAGLKKKMDPDLYDEFGNYVGPELESESDSESEEEKEREEEEEEEEDMQEGEEREEEEMARSMAIVLHEDKKYYPTAGEVGHPSPPPSMLLN